MFTTAAGTLLGWLTARSGSVLPAAVGHGAINAIAGVGALVLQGQPNPLVGPLPIGIVGCVGYVVAAVLLARHWPPSSIVDQSTRPSERVGPVLA